MAVDGRTAALVLAAGEGTRMQSDMAKVLHTLCGKPMIRWVVEAVRRLGPERIVVIVGHQADRVQAEMAGEGLEFVLQLERLGTGHAAMQAEPALGRFGGTILVLNGDTPLLTSGTLGRFVEAHHRAGAVATVLTAELDDPGGYGRIIRDETDGFLRIVEHRDATEEERRTREINSGIFCFEAPDFFPALGRLERKNVQGEYYITDVMEILRRDGAVVGAFRCDQREEVLGINTIEQLRAAEKLKENDG
ncbi:MAG: NTP transferase domain-containing protein [Candidatus Krumholzibacteriota bacterium]|nr:NTP transferase domain-containing protein [Candidatus Krumholzibacteriota bacterium]